MNEAKRVPAKGEAEFFKSRHSICAAEDHGHVPGFAVGAVSLWFQGVHGAFEVTMLDLGVECDQCGALMTENVVNAISCGGYAGAD